MGGYTPVTTGGGCGTYSPIANGAMPCDRNDTGEELVAFAYMSKSIA